MTVLQPQVEPDPSEFLDGPMRERVRLRLQRFVDAHVADLLAPLLSAVAASARDPVLRGLLHRLAESMGVSPFAAAAEIPPTVAGRLKPLGVHAGRFALFIPALLKPRASSLRAQLWALWRGVAVPALPPAGLVSITTPTDWPDGFAAAAGWQPTGPVLVRLMSPSGSRRSWPGSVAAAACRCPPGSPLACRSGQRPCRQCCTRSALSCTRPRALPTGQYGPPAPTMMARLAPASRAGGRSLTGSARHRRGRSLHWQGCGCSMSDVEDRDWQRLDRWLWCARFPETPSCMFQIGGRGQGAGQPDTDRQTPCAPARGRRADHSLGEEVRVVQVVALAARRGPSPEARSLYRGIDAARGTGPFIGRGCRYRLASPKWLLHAALETSVSTRLAGSPSVPSSLLLHRGPRTRIAPARPQPHKQRVNRQIESCQTGQHAWLPGCQCHDVDTCWSDR